MTQSLTDRQILQILHTGKDGDGNPVHIRTWPHEKYLSYIDHMQGNYQIREEIPYQTMRRLWDANYLIDKLNDGRWTLTPKGVQAAMGEKGT